MAVQNLIYAATAKPGVKCLEKRKRGGGGVIDDTTDHQLHSGAEMRPD